ncbi:MAG TPA: hypothetical protein VFO85_20090 [Vicinamibacteria bacterium]|nr:hypothetical protein [Vicinamibacteria bacterium]
MQALGDEAAVRAMLDDPDGAPDPRVRAALGFIRKLAQSPSEVGPADVKPLLEVGVSRQAAADAAYVCFLFTIYTRLADTLGWDVPGPEAFAAGARNLLSRGYR